MKSLDGGAERSVQVRLGLVLALLSVLALVSMLSTLIIAETTKGEAAAINLAGTLRMQSYRIATLLLDRWNPDISDQAGTAVAAMDRLEHTLVSPVLTVVLPANPRDARRTAYTRALTNWRKAIRPLFTAHLELLQAASLDSKVPRSMSTLSGRSPQFLPSVHVFVDHADQLVKLLELDIESKNLLLRIIQTAALLLTLGAVSITVYIFQTGVFGPLRGLLVAAESIRSHELAARVQHTGPDELGQVGRAFNLMATELSRLYASLERRVEDKTASLERSNRSLDLLYRSIGRLYQRPASPDTYRRLLDDFEDTIGIGSGSVCLTPRESLAGTSAAVALRQVQGSEDLCSRCDCDACFSGGVPRWREIEATGANVLSLPLRDIEGDYGVLQWVIGGSEALEPWQLHLLDALCTHMGSAVGVAKRVEQRRRFTVHEERAVIARELHDSLAQSLSYMKIQVSRLQMVLDRDEGDEKATEILAELGDGLNSAYRQLRELLTTFRLKIERGLSEALDKTVAEFSGRAGIPVRVTTRLDGCALSPNEEIHLLQIVRESLANIIHHARARHAEVSVELQPDGTVAACIDDDGVGIDGGSEVRKPGHYGHVVMRERADRLRGALSVQSRAEGGTRVAFSFMPAGRTEPALQQEGGGR